MGEPLVYLVPYLDGDWTGYGPLDPTLDYGLLPPNDAEVHRNFETALQFWRAQTGGKVIFGAHTGTYCRELFYREPMLGYYRVLLANGGELAVHPHEERVRAGHFIEDLDHMRFIISWKRKALFSAGLTPTALRMPYNGYVAGLTRIAEDNQLLVDLSAGPGCVNALWRANWQGAPLSAYWLDYDDPCIGDAPPGRRSRVLEIPLGCDGLGSGPGNYLFNEQIPFGELSRVWIAITQRAGVEGPQTVYFLSHLHSMGDPELKDRCARFLDYAQQHSGLPLTPSEAYARHAEMHRTAS